MRLRWVLVLVLVLLLPLMVMAGPMTNLRGSTDVWLTITGTIASGSGQLSGVINPTSAGFLLADCEMYVAQWGSSPIPANSSINLWVCKETAGRYENCDTINFSPRRPDATFALTPGGTTTTAQALQQSIILPAGPLKALVQNLAGVSIVGGTTNATLKCTPYTPQQ